MELTELKNKHEGETVWVLGSGPSLNFLDARFFEDKIVVSTNYSALHLGVRPQYVFSHYHGVTNELTGTADAVVTLLKDTRTHASWVGDKPSNLVFIEQDDYSAPGAAWNPFEKHQPREDSLVYGSSSIHGSMHLAAYLGAKHLVMVGADCGTLDNEHRVKGYPEGNKPWELYDKHDYLMKRWLIENYGVTVYSLNPFINLNLEGHTFRGVS